MICGFIKPDKGEIDIHPDFIDNKNDFPKSFGIIIDRPAYISSKTGYEEPIVEPDGNLRLKQHLSKWGI